VRPSDWLVVGAAALGFLLALSLPVLLVYELGRGLLELAAGI
jgi:hypothetical protein